MLTASHNPSAYNGLKFNDDWGAPAPVEVTREIGVLANRYYDNPPARRGSQVGSVRLVDFTSDFANALIASVQKAQGGQLAPILDKKMVVDAKHGTAAPVWEVICQKCRLRDYTILHAEPRSDFGNLETNPTAPGALDDLRHQMRILGADAGFAHDPDADRHVIVDESGTVLSPEETAVLILYHLVRQHQPVWGIATTLASSLLVHAAATQWQVHFEETPVGFKYFAPALKAARLAHRIGLAVESSGGFSASFHTLEKCGFLPCLWVLEIAAARNLPVSALREELHREVGTWTFREVAIHFDPDKKRSLVDLFKSVSPAQLSDQLGLSVTALDSRDGLKAWVGDNAWMLWRLSGTEPVARLYVEAPTGEETSQLQHAAEGWIRSRIS
ncbi:MAG: hypothetical protein AAB066_03055, partial [Candidatus Margulisiibacteriota bacterium]